MLCYSFVTVNEIGEIIVKTKFIGLDGYSEIESVSKKRRTARQSKNLTTSQKTVRFVKRAVTLCAKNIKRKTAGQTASKKVRRPQSTIFDRQYAQTRRVPATAGSAMDSLQYLRSMPSGKKFYAHSAPSEPHQHKIVKKKVVMAVAACVTAIMLSCVTVASALDAPQPEKTEEPKTNVVFPATSDELSYSLDTPNMYMNNAFASLYIDGELIGTTNDPDALENALDQYLIDCRAGYDNTTTTKFVNDVRVDRHGPDDSVLLTAGELMQAAADKFSVKLETNWSYESEIDYETDITYDENENSDYETVVTEGKPGTEEINIRLTYIDGNFVNADVISTELISEPVTETIIRGAKQDQQESASVSAASGQFIWPFPHTHNITSLFEWRWGRMHQGIDIAGGDDYGQPIIAADSGRVTWSGNDGGGYGNYVMIDHGNGYMTVYAHACAVACSTGDYVNQGDVIAYCGSTGNSTGPHLHFEVRVDGTQVDPLGYVS